MTKTKPETLDECFHEWILIHRESYEFKKELPVICACLNCGIYTEKRLKYAKDA
jgi:hypothetical protein